MSSDEALHKDALVGCSSWLLKRTCVEWGIWRNHWVRKHVLPERGRGAGENALIYKAFAGFSSYAGFGRRSAYLFRVVLRHKLQ